MAFIELRGIAKSFGRNTVVKGLSLSVEKGEFVSFLGGSGCGKTTTLRMIAGFETPTEGSILLDGEDVSRVTPNKRKLGMVFQNYALFPNMTARRNIAFGLRIARGTRARRRARSRRGSTRCSSSSTWTSSRIAIPTSSPAASSSGSPSPAPSPSRRGPCFSTSRSRPSTPRSACRLRDDIRDIQRKLGITTIYVTHDQEEALSISDRVAVMKDGLIEQIGAPFEIYNRPATPYVATFIGTLNVLPAVVVDPAAGMLEVGGPGH